jgi:hypothetical protein
MSLVNDVNYVNKMKYVNGVIYVDDVKDAIENDFFSKQ